MSILVESLRRLYHMDPPKVSLDKLNEMLAEGKLKQEEYDYIIA
jgi:hypothetical protein